MKTNMSAQSSVNCSHNNPKQVHVLWTGGFDSTFRMVQLSKYDIIVQPYYLTDIKASEKNELQAIADITKDIEMHPETKCKIQSLIKVSIKDLRPDKGITDAYRRLRKSFKLGYQYVWLSQFAKQRDVELELGFELEPGPANDCIEKYGAMKEVSKGEVSYCVLDSEKSSEDVMTIFGRFRFPLPLFKMSKLEELEQYKKLGFEHTLSKTWFCYNPIDGIPCGLCNPCASTIEAGMAFRLPEEALERYYRIREKPIRWILYRINRRIRHRNFKFY